MALGAIYQCGPCAAMLEQCPTNQCSRCAFAGATVWYDYAERVGIRYKVKLGKERLGRETSQFISEYRSTTSGSRFQLSCVSLMLYLFVR